MKSLPQLTDAPTYRTGAAVSAARGSEASPTAETNAKPSAECDISATLALHIIGLLSDSLRAR